MSNDVSNAKLKDDQIRNMAVLIERLVSIARHAGVKSKTPEQALKYLEKQGLLDASRFLRQENAE